MYQYATRSNRFRFIFVHRTQQLRLLHVQSAVQLVVEAATARSGVSLDEDLHGRHAIARVALQEQLVVFVAGYLRVQRLKRNVARGTTAVRHAIRRPSIGSEHAFPAKLAPTPATTVTVVRMQQQRR